MNHLRLVHWPSEVVTSQLVRAEFGTDVVPGVRGRPTGDRCRASRVPIAYTVTHVLDVTGDGERPGAFALADLPAAQNISTFMHERVMGWKD